MSIIKTIEDKIKSMISLYEPMAHHLTMLPKVALIFDMFSNKRKFQKKVFYKSYKDTRQQLFISFSKTIGF